jgi:hypothetical protein
LQKVQRGNSQRRKTRVPFAMPTALPLALTPVDPAQAEAGGSMATPRNTTPEQIAAARTMQRIQRGHSVRRGVLRAEAGGAPATPRSGPAADRLPEYTSEQIDAATRVQRIQRGHAMRSKKHLSLKLPPVSTSVNAANAAASAVSAIADPVDSESLDVDGPYRVNIILSNDGGLEALQVHVQHATELAATPSQHVLAAAPVSEPAAAPAAVLAAAPAVELAAAPAATSVTAPAEPLIATAEASPATS